MRTLLHLDASAHRSDESVSRRLTAEYAAGWRARHGGDGYRYRDLAVEPAPPLGHGFCALGRRLERRGPVPARDVAALTEGPDEQREWALTEPLIAEVLAADTILVGAPLYNFGVSASLKAWIDRISFPGAFLEHATGASRLRGTRIVVVTASGGAYGPGTPREGRDFQTPYLRAYLRHLGVPDAGVHVVAAELTMATVAPHLAGDRDRAARSLAAARALLSSLVTDDDVVGAH